VKALHGNDEVALVMRSPVIAVHPGTLLRAAATVLRQNDIGAVAVTDNDELVGVLSERDLVRALGDGVDPDVALVTEVMAGDPCTVEPSSPLWAATMLMLRTGVRHLPVTDGGRAVGMVSIRDALVVMERDRIIEPASHIETVH
jgi:CBS domain-containing protein